MIQQNVAGLRVVLPGKNPFARRHGNKPFPTSIAEFFPDESGAFNTVLDFTINLKDGNNYLYRYQFPPAVLIPPAQGFPSFWAEACNKSWFFFLPPALTGGRAYNAFVRPLFISKSLN